MASGKIEVHEDTPMSEIKEAAFPTSTSGSVARVGGDGYLPEKGMSEGRKNTKAPKRVGYDCMWKWIEFELTAAKAMNHTHDCERLEKLMEGMKSAREQEVKRLRIRWKKTKRQKQSEGTLIGWITPGGRMLPPEQKYSRICLGNKSINNQWFRCSNGFYDDAIPPITDSCLSSSILRKRLV